VTAQNELKNSKRNWTKSDIQFIKENSYLSDEEIAKTLNRSKNAVSLKRIRLGITRKKKWTGEEIQFLKDNYFLLDEKLANKLNRTLPSIRFKRKQLGISKRYKPIYSINIDFFKGWSNEMAYILGFIYADGHIRVRKSKAELGIKSKDLKILSAINKAMKSNYPIKKRETEASYIYTLFVNRKEVVRDLMKLGLIPRKSLTITFPEIPKKYLFHFIRGYFDGDGHVGITRDNYLSITFVSGSRKFLEGLNKKLRNQTISSTSLTSPKNYSFYTLSILKKSRNKFKELIYKDATLFLKRKKDIFENYFTSNNKKTIKCIDCSRIILRTGTNHKRCKKCKKDNQRKMNKKYRQKMKKTF
jgi:hypothetical protein